MYRERMSPGDGAGLIIMSRARVRVQCEGVAAQDENNR